MRVAALMVSLLAASSASAADPALVTRMAHLASHYHEDPARLDAGRAELEAAVVAEPSVPVLVSLAQISYIWGDVRRRRATTSSRPTSAAVRSPTLRSSAIPRTPMPASGAP